MAEHPWDDVKQKFNAALSLSVKERDLYLKQLSTESTQLHHEVADLLAQHVDADEHDFLASLKIGKQTEADLAETIAHILPTVDIKATIGDGDSLCTLSTMAEIPETSYIGELGDYQLIEQIGRGGMGVVYKAYQKNVGRTVALKVIAGGSLSSAEDIARFHDEASAAGRLTHPGIVAVYDAGEHEGNHYFSMAYIEGESLASYVGPDRTRLKPREAARLIEEVCRAVQYAHDHFVIHRDIKPANIMLDKSGQPLLADFGLAKLVGNEGYTQTGQAMGTPNYMAPEQAKGQLELISNRTDVYSLGGTLYALLKGRPPIEGKNLLDTLKKVESAAPETLYYRGSQIPLDLWIICEKCLAKKPDDRYESATALADDLQRFLQGFPISARAVGHWGRLVRWSQRNPLIATLIGTIAATLVIATLVSISFAVQARAALARAEANASELNQSIEDTFVFASEGLLANEPGMQVVRQNLLLNAQNYYQKMLLTNQGSEGKLAKSAYLLGRVQFQLGLYEEAKQSLEKSLEIQTQIVSAAADKTQAYLDLGAVHSELAKLGEKVWNSRSEDKPTVDAQATLHVALEHAHLCVDWRAKALAENSQDREVRRLLASAKMNLGLLLIEDYQLKPQSASLGEAELVLQEAQDLRQELLEDTPNDTKLRQDLARGFGALGRLRETEAAVASTPEDQKKLLQESLDLRLQATQTLEKLPDNAKTSESQSLLATCYRLCGHSYFQLGMIDEAIASDEQSIQVMQRLSLNNPRVYSYREQVADAQFELAQFLIANQDSRGYEFSFDCQQTLIEGLGAEPNNRKAADLLLIRTDSLCASFVEKDFHEKAFELIENAKQLLASIQIYGSDRSLIKETIETLDAKAAALREQAGAEDRTT